MQIDGSCRLGLARAAMVVILAGLVAGCVGPSEPAPVYLRGAGEPVIAPMPGAPPALQVIVKRGQTLDGYAYTYHVPKSAIIAANGLRPPYKLEAGRRLTIPRGAVQQAMTPSPSAARLWSTPPAIVSEAPQQQAAIPPPPRSPEAIATPVPASHPPQTIFTTPIQPLPPVQPMPAEVKTQPATPPSSPAKVEPDIIPLDGPPIAKQAEAGPLKPPATPPQQAPTQPAPPQAAVPLGSTPSAAAVPAAQAAAAPAPDGRFPWPVRGHVVGAYGNAPGGGHNDGINIAAPLGTPVRAIDGGTVVYSGNEVKGYGNIVLIRHANGWISAYAHLDDVSVRQGQAISPGEVIAKVGNSGGVSQPQLHFELRRGQKPVNPTEFLAPAPSAQGAGDRAG